MFKKNIRALAFTVLIVIIDQITKLLIKFFLADGQVINILGRYVRLNFITNPGMAFGIRIGGGSLFYIIFTIIASIVIIIFLFSMKENHFWTRIALASILGGALGNLSDRIITGEVIDFVEIGPWPIFNFADVAVTFGMIVLIIIVFVEKKKSQELQEERFEIN